MSGGRQYWNEDTQRWEETGTMGAVPTPTPPPAAPPPATPPRVPPAEPPPYRPTAPDGVPAAGPPPRPVAEPPRGEGAAPDTAGDTATDTGTGVDPEAETFWSGLRGVDGPDGPAGRGGPTGSQSGGASADDVNYQRSDGTWSDSAWSSPEHAAGGAGSATAGDAGRGDPYPYPAQWSTAAGETQQQPLPSAWDGAPPWDPGQQYTPGAGRSRRVMWAVVAGVAVVAVVVCLAVFRTGGFGDDDKDGNKPLAASDTATDTSSSGTQDSSPTGTATSPSASAASNSPSASASSVPPGFESYSDDEGFSIVVPTGWNRITKPSQYGMRVVNYRDADRSHRIQIYQVAESSPDESFTKFLSAETGKAHGFEELSLTNLDQGDFVGSRLEYLADRINGEPDVGTWHVFDERFVAGDNRVYAIAVYGPDAGGTDDELATLTTAVESFCPAGAPCAATDTD